MLLHFGAARNTLVKSTIHDSRELPPQVFHLRQDMDQPRHKIERRGMISRRGPVNSYHDGNASFTFSQ